jgi:hypothetical protein
MMSVCKTKESKDLNEVFMYRNLWLYDHPVTNALWSMNFVIISQAKYEEQ